MAAVLSFGSVPPLYREIYDILCPGYSNDVTLDKNVFVKLFAGSALSGQILGQIFDLSQNKQGFLNRNGLYRALALIALSQQGKQIHENLLDTFADAELPKPSVGDVNELKVLFQQLQRHGDPSVLAYTYSEVCEIDYVQVELMPEKKGIILKHVEYEVSSKRYRTTVSRRYNDFVAFQELLISRFPYRLIPRLPPKKMMNSNKEFIECRRKSLKRFLTLVARHPTLIGDPLLHFFLTSTASDFQHKIREEFKSYPDEFLTSDVAAQARDLVPLDVQQQFSSSREQIKLIGTAISRMKDISDRLVTRSLEASNDMLLFGKELRALHDDQSRPGDWGNKGVGATDTWAHIRRHFKELSIEFAAISEKCSVHADREDEGVVEKYNLLIDVLAAYKDLCERLEKGLVSHHQKAISKMGDMKKKRVSVTLRGSEQGMLERLESRIIEQENVLNSMEHRSHFSLHCIHLETQLIYIYLELLPHILHNLANVELRGHSELLQIWEGIRPRVDSLLPNNNSSSPAGGGGDGTKYSPLYLDTSSSASSPRRSPLASPSSPSQEQPPSF